MDIEYKLINCNYLNELVDVHKTVFYDYFITNLGDKVICTYYESFMMDEGTIAYGAFDQGVLIGFSIFVNNYENIMNSYLKRKRGLLSKSILMRILLNKVIIKSLFVKIKKILFKTKSKYNEDSDVLLSIGVKEKYRGKSVARNLMALGENAIYEKKVNAIGLSVKKNNQNAISFYTRYGYNIAYETEDLYYMRKIKND